MVTSKEQDEAAGFRMDNGGVQDVECTWRLSRLIAGTPEIFAMLPTARLDETLRHAFRDGLRAVPHNGARILVSRENSAAADDELVGAALHAAAEIRTHATCP